jgi:hypothetical protein
MKRIIYHDKNGKAQELEYRDDTGDMECFRYSTKGVISFSLGTKMES